MPTFRRRLARRRRGRLTCGTPPRGGIIVMMTRATTGIRSRAEDGVLRFPLHVTLAAVFITAFALFLDSGVWREYGGEYLWPEQMDEVVLATLR
jgi:hypothetical protein